MALLDYLAGLGYVGFVTMLGLFLAPDPTGVVPFAGLLAGGLVAAHALVRVRRAARVLAVSAGVTIVLTILVSVGFGAFGVVLPAPTLLGTLAVVGTGPLGYALVLVSDVATVEPDGTDDDATEV